MQVAQWGAKNQFFTLNTRKSFHSLNAGGEVGLPTGAGE